MVFVCKKVLALIIFCLFISGCSKIDDYWLGKDNTPLPTPLSPIESKIPLKKNWTASVGAMKKDSAYFKLTPAILGNVIYVAAANGQVDALNLSTGKSIWSKKLATSLLAGPVLGKNFIIVTTDSSTLLALNKETGQEVWHSGLSGDVLSKPLITQNKVIAKTIDGNVYAFDLSTGQKLWSRSHGAPDLILKASSSPVVVDNKTLLIGFPDGKLDAMEIETGQLLWQRNILYASGASDIERLIDIDADPIVEGNVVLLASYQGYVGAFSLNDGQFIWQKPASTYKNIAVKGNSLYMIDSHDVIWSINKQTGQVNWKQIKLKSRGLTEPVLMGDELIVGDKTGILHVIATQNGDLLSRTELGNAIAIAPAVKNNNIYVLTANGQLNRFSLG